MYNAFLRCLLELVWCGVVNNAQSHINKKITSITNVLQEYKKKSDFELASSVEKIQCKLQYFICKRLFSLQSLYTFL